MGIGPKGLLSPRRVLLLVVVTSVVLVLKSSKAKLTPKRLRSHSWPKPRFDLSPSELPTLPLLQHLASFTLLDPSLRPQLPLPTTPLRPDQLFKLSTPIPPSKDDAPLLTLAVIGAHEAAFIVEFITWHRLIGVGRFFVIDVVEGGDRTGEGKRGGALSEVLKPWREEGSVVLIEVEWSKGRPSTWQKELLSVMGDHLLPRTAWFGHWDTDEFLLPPVTHPPTLPTLSSTTSAWSFPLYARLERLDQAGVVPLYRFQWENVGRETINGPEADGWETVTEAHTWRREGETWDPELSKTLAHPDYKANVLQFGSQHACWPADESKTPILDPYTGHRLEHYSTRGIANISQGFTLMHYYHRSLANCLSKLEVLAEANIVNWRTSSGAEGCHKAFTQPSQVAEKWLHKDGRVRDSWEGRMVRELIRYWWVQSQGDGGRWRWMGEETEVENWEERRGVVKLLL